MRHTNCCGKRLDFWFLSWPALDTFDEPCWTQSLTFINGCHWSGYICAEIVNCTLRLIIICYGVYRRGLRDNMRQRSHMQQHTITGGRLWQEFNIFFLPFFLYLYALLIMPSCESRAAGRWVLTVPVLITGKRAPERWDASWHPGLILTSINTSRGSPWSDYRRGWIRSRNVGKQEGRWGLEESEGGRGQRNGHRWEREDRKRGEQSDEMMKGGGQRRSGGWWQRR